MIIDFHNHLIPGVDDGAVDVAESLAALRHLRDQGVGVVVTTPHVDAALTLDGGGLAERLAEIDTAWSALEDALAREDVGVEVLRGVELNLDTPLPDVDDGRLRLAGGAFVLMEFPFMAVPPQSARAVRALRDQGIVPVVAHPERYRNLDGDLQLPGTWRDAGAFLQVNGASLLGRYGKVARDHAFTLLERGWIDYLSSDYHARGDAQVAAYVALLEEAGLGAQVERLTHTNPARLLEGRLPLPVAPCVARRSLVQRLTGWLR